MRAVTALHCLLLFLSSYGVEGRSYFQQRVDFRIDVELDDIAHRLIGDLEMDYHNNSPDVLDTLFIHLWPNAYSSRNTDLGDKLLRSGDFELEFSRSEERGNITGLDFSVDGRRVDHYNYNDQIDIAFLVLNESLEPGEKMTLRTPFEVKIPVGRFSRLGHIGQSYQVTQWFPKPAVYDMDGWHPMTYLSQGEFYSEFGNFEVSITLPRNYIVAATGQLQDLDEIDFLRERAALGSEQVENSDSNGFPSSSEVKKTVHFSQEDIHDFAWFADKRFNVMHREIALEGSNRTLDAWVFHTNEHAEAWAKSMEYVVDGTLFYSRLVGDYPYDHVSVVDGTLSAGGGMEYPMITVVNGTSNDRSLERVIVHEIGHNWFYGILASNEREHAWMDEGINSYYEYRYFKEKYRTEDPSDDRLIDYVQGMGSNVQELGYRYSACRHQDQALSTSSADFSPLNYGTMVYTKGAKVMDHLSSVLGEEEFDRSMQQYFEEWKFRHPGPAELQNCLERSSGQDIAWLFEDLVNKNVKVDHRICCLDREDSSVLVVSNTDFSGPVAVGFMKDGRLVDEVVGKGQRFKVSSEQEFDAVLIDPKMKSLQLNRRNDHIRVKGILKKWEFPELRIFTGIGLDERSKLYVSPALAWNEQDRFMIGAYLSNAEILFKDFEWTLLPMLSSGQETLVGMGNFRKTFWMSETGPGRLDLSIGGRRFSLDEYSNTGTSYSALEAAMMYEYQDPSLLHGRHRISLEVDRIDFRTELGSEVVPIILRDRQDMFVSLDYQYDQRAGLATLLLKTGIEAHKDFQKLIAEASVRQVLNAKDKTWFFRLYAGKMWSSTESLIPLGARLNLSGTSGSQEIDYSSDDYRYENLFLNRSQLQSSRPNQIVLDRGAFVQMSTYGASDDWVVAMNTEIDLPLAFPISIYGNLGAYGIRSSGSEFLYETGARIDLIRDIFDISFPITQSDLIRTQYNDFDIDYVETIRFQLRLEMLTIRNLVDNISL